MIVNLSAGDEVTGKEEYRRNLVKGQSARLVCGYLYATAGEGESSTLDLVFGGHNLDRRKWLADFGGKAFFQ